MARLSKPTDLACPGINVQGAQLDLPADLPEGGYLCVIVGENPAGVPVACRPIPRGAMVAIIEPNAAEMIRNLPAYKKACELVADPAKLRQAAMGIPPHANGNGA